MLIKLKLKKKSHRKVTLENQPVLLRQKMKKEKNQLS
jgi:hypothetical protein